MTFTLPSCSDAKKQQEHLAPTTTSQIQQAAHLVNGTVNDSGSKANKAMPPPKGNPYAKRQQQFSSTDSTSQTFRPSHINQAVAKNDTIPAQKITQNHSVYSLPPQNLCSNATFSQAFSGMEESTHIDNDESVIGTEEKSLDQVQSSADDNTNSTRENHMSLQTHVLHVSNRQRGNGILRYIRNVPFTFSDIIPDFITSPNRCQLFLSFKYHCLHPTYIHKRISELRSDFDLRVLLCLVDVDDNASILFALNKLCVVNNMTLILAWSEEEAARYLETFKTLENNNGSIIQRREQTNFVDQITDTLTSIKSVNKTDAVQLLGHLGSLQGIIKTPIDKLGLVPGLGPTKVRRLYDAFQKPFFSVARKSKIEYHEESVLQNENHHPDTQKGDSYQNEDIEKDTDDQASRNENKDEQEQGESSIQVD